MTFYGDIIPMKSHIWNCCLEAPTAATFRAIIHNARWKHEKSLAPRHFLFAFLDLTRYNSSYAIVRSNLVVPGKDCQMFPRVGLPEVIVILVLALLIFGPGRITKVASELGKGIHAFQEGLKSEDKGSDSQS